MADRIFVEIDGSARDLSRASNEAQRDIRAIGRTARTENATVGRSFSSLTGRSRAFHSSLGDINRQATFFRNALRLIKWPAFIAGAGGAAQALSALAAGAIGLTSALGPLSGAVVAFPAAAGAAAQAAGTLQLAFSGIAEAVKAGADAQIQAGADAESSAQAQTAAAEQVRAAKEALSSAQRQATYAQESLTDARAEATQQLDDMQDAVDRSRLSEQRASLSVRQAKKELREVLADPEATRLEIKDARLRVKEAQQDLSDTREQARDERRELAEARRSGVNGMDVVVDARRDLAEANRGVAAASRGVASAERDAADAMGEASAGADAYQQALAKLTPSGREFAQFLLSLKPRLDELKETAAGGLLPGVEEGMRSALRNFPELRDVLGETAEELGDLAREGGRFFGREAFGADFETIGRGNVRLLDHMGDSGLHLADALRHIMVEAQPLLGWMGRSVEAFSRFIEKEAAAGRETGELGDFFEETRDVMERVVSIGGSLASVLQEIGHAAHPLDSMREPTTSSAGPRARPVATSCAATSPRQSPRSSRPGAWSVTWSLPSSSSPAPRGSRTCSASCASSFCPRWWTSPRSSLQASDRR